MSKQIIAIDWSNDEDQTAVSCICSKCKQIIEHSTQSAEVNALTLLVYKQCLHCGVNFTEHKFM